jgi:hypothetical protein
MTIVRKAGWFVVLALSMAAWMGVLGALRGVAEAGVIASHVSGEENRAEDLSKVQSFLENKVVLQKLIDCTGWRPWPTGSRPGRTTPSGSSSRS